MTDNTTGQYGSGGGIANLGTLTLQSGSSVSGNRAGGKGGGITNSNGIFLESGSRVTGNTASDGGGISNNHGYVDINAGAIICSNLPLTAQCVGGVNGTGTCPAPSQECPD